MGTYQRTYAGGFVSEAVYAPREAALALLGNPPLGTRRMLVTGSTDMEAALCDARSVTVVLQAAGFTLNPYVTRVKPLSTGM